MDSTAITFCMDNELPIVVFDMLGARATSAGHPRGRTRSVRWSRTDAMASRLLAGRSRWAA